MLLVKVSLLRPPSSASARSRAQLYATGDPRSPRHGLESPCHVARAFQPVGLGRARPSSVLRPPILPPLAPLAFFRGQPSVIRPQPLALRLSPVSSLPSARCQIACAAIRDYPPSYAQGHSHRSPCPPRCGRRSNTSWLQSGTVCPSSRNQYQHAAKLGAKPARTNRSGPRATPHGEQASRDVT